ncbi:preprotein translocase subunit YajC [uncultured Clostridium sp.]|uniref:preprotein translocase subunit YajC n=1 Tax=uncultured Clostridium sp. TaxID=59620 RepID=UPI00262A1EFD|nr:preprotein translocase subunit YajC [uncultured Clostridium sp.]
MHGMLLNIIPIVVILALFVFMIIMPEKKRKKRYSEMMDTLKVNDEVCTKGGMVGTIVQMDDEFIIIETTAKTRIKFMKAAVNNKIDRTSK